MSKGRENSNSLDNSYDRPRAGDNKLSCCGGELPYHEVAAAGDALSRTQLSPSPALSSLQLSRVLSCLPQVKKFGCSGLWWVLALYQGEQACWRCAVCAASVGSCPTLCPPSQLSSSRISGEVPPQPLHMLVLGAHQILWFLSTRLRVLSYLWQLSRFHHLFSE